jgi:hypothetical protein
VFQSAGGNDKLISEGDHVHRFGLEVECRFASVRRLIEDFNADVASLAQQLGDEG